MAPLSRRLSGKLTAGEPSGRSGFRFDRLGLSVPTTLISPHVEAGTIVHTPLTNTSVICTPSEQRGCRP